MNNISKKFEKIEKQIAIGKERGLSVKSLLREKISLLKLSYDELSKTIEEGNFQAIVPIYAKELAFLNSIKSLENELNISTQNTEEEIARVQSEMRQNGFGWILDNLPQQKPYH